MAKRVDQRVMNVSVVGLSGTEKDKGVTGVGKSCLCNRFMRPLADDYYTDHISVLSQSDFGGRVVNNDHFLYWGVAIKTEEGVDYRFKVIEQTEFIDDSSFQPFKSGKTEPYYKRCSATKLQSAEKLAYICKNQLGLEHEFPEHLLPEGRISVEGFLCLFDVSRVQERPIERQVEFAALVLNHLMKSKKPIILVTTKNDEAYEPFVREAERLVGRKEFKGSIPIVETSSHHNVNIEHAFLSLAHMIDRTKGRPKPVAFVDAARARKELLDVATEAYLNLLRQFVVDYKTLWMTVYQKIIRHGDYTHFVELFGTDHAKKLFKKLVRQLKDDFVKQKQDIYLKKLEIILPQILPDLSTIQDRSWPATLRWVQRQDIFERYFVDLPEKPWHMTDFLESTDNRIPFDLLDESEAETVFRNHVNGLRAEYRKLELKKQFKQLLVDNHAVCPGKSLGDVAIFFLGRECFSTLSEKDKHDIYEEHQRELQQRAKREFIELLLENAVFFSQFEGKRVTEADLKEIDEKIKYDPRCQALVRLEEVRKTLLYQHINFAQTPSRDSCFFKQDCMEHRIEQVLSTKARRPQSWSRNCDFLLDSEDNRLNLVILGADGLGDTLAREIRTQCHEDEYTLDGQMYSLDYRPIDGDVTLPQNSLKTADFLPHGCYCVFNSSSSLGYLRRSLESTVMWSDLSRGERSPFQGLPIVVVLAHNPATSEKGLMILRDEGQALADRLQCPFVDVPSSMMTDSSRRFHQDQIGLAMHHMVKCIKHRSSFVQPWPIAESLEPDIRILMCYMCGDSFDIELPLAPLLNHQCCYVTSRDSNELSTITLEAYLDDSKRKVELTVTSYHGAADVKHDELFHGHILVFSAKRKASLATLGAFANTSPPVPTKILAVTESGGASAFFSSSESQNLITEGNAYADQKGASFMTTCANFAQQTASYTPFFKECWDKKPATESAFDFACDSANHQMVEPQQPNHRVNEQPPDRILNRPPPDLPKPPKRFDSYQVSQNHTTKSSSNSIDFSQSTEDSEPLYDRAHTHHCTSLSDSEADRASSTSPPPGGDSGLYSQTGDSGLYASINDGEEQLYSQIDGGDKERLLHPNHAQVKSRRSLYAAKYRKSFPSASSSFASSSYREDSTDTDSSVLSPKLHHRERVAGEPHYQFRKSNSMRLALKEGEQGIFSRSMIEEPRKRLLKSTTLPASARHPDSLDAGFSDDMSVPPQTRPKPRPLDHGKFATVTKVLDRNIRRNNNNVMQIPGKSVAPLATPEPIEIGDYATVKDALAPLENDYAEVQDVLPSGKLHRIRSTFAREKGNQQVCTDSDSEFSSLERDGQESRQKMSPADIYSRVHRRPTPHKKKHKNPRHSDPTLPSLPSFTDERQLLVHADHVDRVHRDSPSEGSEGTGDELNTARKQKKKRSFRSKKKKQYEDRGLIISPPFSDPDSPHSKLSLEDDGAYSGRYGDVDSEDLVDGSSGNIRQLFKLKSMRGDPEKQRRKEEKKKLKEDEKRQKELQKKERKMKKKDSKSGLLTSQMSMNPLEDMAQSDENLVPLFVEKCVGFIEEEGLVVEGIFRVPGNRQHVEIFMDKFKEDPLFDIPAHDIPVNAVATALKQFFSDLPEPLIPSSLLEELKEATAVPDKSTRLLALRGVVKKLPVANYEVLQFLVGHLNRVAENSKENKMDVENLAICWWPTLLRPDFTTFDEMSLVSKYLEDIVKTIIEQYGFFFFGEEELAT